MLLLLAFQQNEGHPVWFAERVPHGQHCCALQAGSPRQQGHFSGHGMSRAGGQAINNYNRSEGQNVRSTC